MLRLAAATLCCGAASVLSSPSPPLPVATARAPSGVYLGSVVDGTRTWRGIPYAEPPVDDLRWRRTVPAGNLTEPLVTTKFQPDCAQIGPGWPSLGGMISPCNDYVHGCPNFTWSEATSEDCLYLNVYAPDNSGKEPDPEDQGFPVIVYFPSGAFQWGAANDWENNAYKKATAPGWNSSVFVTANYRTGIFGFLASDSLSKRAGDNSSGLFGIHDQTMVLKWVQEYGKICPPQPVPGRDRVRFICVRCCAGTSQRSEATRSA
jgi:para-nitrobenzyl esterase